MSQHDYNIDNQLFPATRTDVNNAFLAVNSNNSGNTAPSTTYANMFWADTANNLLKQRNTANTAWVTIGSLNVTGWGLSDAATAYAQNLSDLKNVPVAANKIAFKAGRTTAGDFGHGFYRWVAGDSTTADDATVVVSNVGTGRWFHLYEGFCYGELFGAVGNGTTDDAAAMQKAVVYCHNKGGGVLTGVPGKTYRFASTTEAATYTSNALLALLKNVSIDGQGSTFHNDSMPNRFVVVGGMVNPPASVTTKYITANFTHTDTTLTLDNTTGLANGNEVWVRVGEDAGDTVESSYFFFARITNIASNVITIDKPVNQAGTVASFVNAENKSVRVFPTSAENYFIKNLTFNVVYSSINNTGSTKSFPAVYQYRGRNVIWENVIVKGTQAAYYQYMENISMENVKVIDSPFVQSSAGRAWNFAECRGVHVNNWLAEKIEASVAYVEFYSSGIRFTNGIIQNNVSSWPLGGQRYLFGAIYNTQLTVDNLTVYGYGGWNMVENGSGADYSSFSNLDLKTVTRPRNFGTNNLYGTLLFNTPSYIADTNVEMILSSANWFWQRVPLTASMAGSYFYMPPGLVMQNGMIFTSSAVVLANVTEIRVCRDGQAANTGIALKTNMTVGQIKRFGMSYGTDDGSSGLATTPILSRLRLQFNTGGTTPGGFVIIGFQIAWQGNNGTYFNGIALSDTEANQMFA